MKSEAIALAIIDDHQGVRSVMIEMLTGCGFSVIVAAEHGADFFSQLEKTTASPQVCLIDLNMPVMDGFETIAAIRQQGLNIGVVAYSMNNTDKQITKALNAGADIFIDKLNITSETIGRALRKALEKYK